MNNKTEFSSKEAIVIIKKFYYYNAISKTGWAQKKACCVAGFAFSIFSRVYSPCIHAFLASSVSSSSSLSGSGTQQSTGQTAAH